ncbi:uncharacterized protein [Malus domestica]|uniref:uncharacterized protein isoform X1 n=1 Tax=Malus domestica TaxID=3750 RepID=UPI0010AA512F|nr:uncharacterized protein LOC114820180 [Malus domestica]
MAAMYVNGAILSSHNGNSSFQSHSGASSIFVGPGSPSVFTQNFGYGFNASNSSNMAAPQSSFPQYGTSNGNGFQSSGNNLEVKELGFMVIMVTRAGIMVAINQDTWAIMHIKGLLHKLLYMQILHFKTIILSFSTILLRTVFSLVPLVIRDFIQHLQMCLLIFLHHLFFHQGQGNKGSTLSRKE